MSTGHNASPCSERLPKYLPPSIIYYDVGHRVMTWVGLQRGAARQGHGKVERGHR